MRIILDTNVFVAALRSNAGASRRLLRAIFEGKVRCVTSTALWMEYEDLIHRPIWGDTTTLVQREILLDALASHSEWVNLYFHWRPNLRDEGDNFLIELAIAGNVDAIVTHNIRDLKSGELVFPQLKILTPDVYLEELL
jgi:putative PIN family toxin of toxin-antitoxin system